VRVEKIVGTSPGGLIDGSSSSMKILITHSGFSLLFFNIVYAIDFQAPFQLQTKPAAEKHLRKRPLLTLQFYICSLIPLADKFMGKVSCHHA